MWHMWWVLAVFHAELEAWPALNHATGEAGSTLASWHYAIECHALQLCELGKLQSVKGAGQAWDII